MPNRPTEGNCTTLTLATIPFDFEVTAIEGLEQAVEMLETTHICTVGGKTFISAATIENGEVSMTVFFDADFDTQAFLAAGKDVGSITWPIPEGQTTAAVWTMDMVPMTIGGITAENDSIISATVGFKVSGDISIVASS